MTSGGSSFHRGYSASTRRRQRAEIQVGRLEEVCFTILPYMVTRRPGSRLSTFEGFRRRCKSVSFWRTLVLSKQLGVVSYHVRMGSKRKAEGSRSSHAFSRLRSNHESLLILQIGGDNDTYRSVPNCTVSELVDRVDAVRYVTWFKHNS